MVQSVTGTLAPRYDFSLRGGGPFALAVFVSAALIFLVEPMVAKMVLPNLGGSPAVWNTCLAFFQIALLTGYLYAHLLQNIKNLKIQVLVHCTLLIVAALTLPLQISGVLGQPDPEHPVLWLLGELALSLGGPFALLSATAPLLQAWFARTTPADPVTGKKQEPYALYAASNAGSLIALLSYPLIVEPLSTLSQQRVGWSAAFVAFIVLLLVIGLLRKQSSDQIEKGTQEPDTTVVSWKQMAVWTALAAVPSSLLMGVTTYMTTDVASAPLLWVIPLALYLITFIIAFKSGQIWNPRWLFNIQAVLLIFCLCLLNFQIGGFFINILINLVTFFLSALIAHQALASKRPTPRHLTLFYLCMSIGGVLGGSFNSFLAPILFSSVLEYPLALVLIALARPMGGDAGAFSLSEKEKKILGLGVLEISILGIVLATGLFGKAGIGLIIFMFVCTIIIAVLMRGRAIYFTICLSVLAILTDMTWQDGRILVRERNFFGIVKIYESTDPKLGPIRVMAHGTTFHGAQALDPARKCQPLTYYAPQAGLGQTIVMQQANHPGLNIAVIGLGTGTLSVYTRATDKITYYEIDPTVIKYASDPQYFNLLSDCSKSKPEFVVGDARFKLASLPEGSLDVLVVDAFSSDTIPTHLLTIEAVRMYLSKLKNDGVVVFNLSNRHLELHNPVLASIQANGGSGLTQYYLSPDNSSLDAASTIALVAAKNEKALAAFAADPRWKTRDRKVAPWSDDYVNLIGALRLGKPLD